MIENILFQELCSLLGTPKSHFAPKRGQPNVLMFVGLQGASISNKLAKFVDNSHYLKVPGRLRL